MLDENFDNDSKNIEQYLSFKLAEQHYGVDILRVKEIRGWSNVTPIPNSPHYVKGVMNLNLTYRYGVWGTVYIIYI